MRNYETVEAVRKKLNYKTDAGVYRAVKVGKINVWRRGEQGHILAYCPECVEAMACGEKHENCQFHAKPHSFHVEL